MPFPTSVTYVHALLTGGTLKQTQDVNW